MAANVDEPELAHLRTKRKSEDTSATTPRPKRSRYVSNACDECKRRKIKCDGGQPCQRCINSSTSCSYKRLLRKSGEPGEICEMAMQMRTVIEKVDSICEKLNGSGVQADHEMRGNHSQQCDIRLPPEEAWSQSLPSNQTKSPAGIMTPSTEYRGPTSSEFSFNLVKGSLRELGVGSCIHSGSSPLPVVAGFHMADNNHFMRLLTQDPLWGLVGSDALRFISLYQNGPGTMYPLVDVQHLISKALILFELLESARAGDYKDKIGLITESLFSNATNKLRILIAIGCVLEKGVTSDVAARLMQSVTDWMNTSFLYAEGIGGVQVLILTAIFHLHMDDELKASRVVCLASRMCLEMGLHRRDTLLQNYPDELSRTTALQIFWSVYMLDRRSSLGLGVPFVIQDNHLDPSLVTLDFDHQYTRIMIPYSKICGKAWHMGNDFCAKDPDAARDDIEYLDYQAIQWQKQIPSELRYPPGGSDRHVPLDDEDQQRQFLQVVLLVRSYQLRNLIYRPALQSSSRIKTNKECTLTAIGIARESLNTLWELNQTTHLPEKHATFFKHFIVSSLGNLLLVAVYATANFWDEIREPFQMALSLLRQLSTRSSTVMRVWNRLKGLEALQTKIRSTPAATIGAYSGPHLINASPNLGTTENAVPQPLDIYGDQTLFDVQIRNEFAGIFDFAVTGDDLFEFPLVD